MGLYVTVVALGSLIFQLINIYFPDPLAYEYGRYAKDSLKWPLSILVVVFPVYAWLSYRTQKDVVENPQKRELKVRKWLIYFTLSLAALVIVGDLVSLIYTFLNGEITVRFILKVLTVFAIAVAVFVYYNWNLKKETMAIKDPTMRVFISAVILVVLAFVVTGFYIAGSPQSARLQKFDDRRVNDLQILQSQLVNYWQTKRALPDSLDALRDDISGFVPPKDPQTGNIYEYVKTGNYSFELCAVFNVGSDLKDAAIAQPVYNPYGYSENWSHDAGRVCFSRTIDPERYPPIPIERVKI